MDDQALRTAFAEFRKNPAHRLIVRVRQVRAGQLRELLARSDAIDLDTFNREVWPLARSTLLRGEEIKASLSEDGLLSHERIEDVDSAIDDGCLELHGNYIWRPGSNVYGSSVAGTDEDKLGHVRLALDILNDPEVRPIEKAKRLTEIIGFGRNTATGLVMVFHPQDVSLWNPKSAETVANLSRESKTLETYQKSARELRDLVGAEDFIELDWFSYLLGNGRYEPKKGRFGQKSATQNACQQGRSPPGGSDHNKGSGAQIPSCRMLLLAD
jgi:hypothetical protein